VEFNLGLLGQVVAVAHHKEDDALELAITENLDAGAIASVEVATLLEFHRVWNLLGLLHVGFLDVKGTFDHALNASADAIDRDEYPFNERPRE
jgi:hypothetical protein